MNTPSPATPLCDQLRAIGEWNPHWQPAYELDPAWTEAFMTMGLKPMLSGALDAKTIEFIAIAVDASCTHMYGPGVRRHIRKALELGATQEEITAVLQCVSAALRTRAVIVCPDISRQCPEVSSVINPCREQCRH